MGPRLAARALVALTGLTCLGSAAHAHTLGQITFRRAVDASEILPEERLDLDVLWKDGCRITNLSDDEWKAFGEVVAALGSNVADPSLHLAVASREDWVVLGRTGWKKRREAGRELLDRLLRGPGRRVGVYAFEPRGDGRCAMARGVHAFAAPDGHAILLHRPYLAARLDGAAAGRRELARTVLHEVFHVLGAVHHKEPVMVGTEEYERTVPVLLACLATDAAPGRCGTPIWSREPVPSTDGNGAAPEGTIAPPESLQAAAESPAP